MCSVPESWFYRGEPHCDVITFGLGYVLTGGATGSLTVIYSISNARI
jgi:hypothetical protein